MLQLDQHQLKLFVVCVHVWRAVGSTRKGALVLWFGYELSLKGSYTEGLVPNAAFRGRTFASLDASIDGFIIEQTIGKW
jgi:hypothetical protein